MKNKTGKYFKYAIGEIVLVVIGILIALQINNWNEGQKANKKETLVLLELLNSINKDLGSYEKYLDPRLEKKKSGLDSLHFYIFDKTTMEDSLFLKFYKKMSQDIYLRFDSGPFEALKSSGLELISNDSLRTAINNAYTVDLPLFSLFGNEYYIDNKAKIYDLKNKLFSLKRIYKKDEIKYLDESVKVKNIINNQDFLSLFALEVEKYKEFKYRLYQSRNTLNNLKKMIESEMKK